MPFYRQDYPQSNADGIALNRRHKRHFAATSASFVWESGQLRALVYDPLYENEDLLQYYPRIWSYAILSDRRYLRTFQNLLIR